LAKKEKTPIAEGLLKEITVMDVVFGQNASNPDRNTPRRRRRAKAEEGEEKFGERERETAFFFRVSDPKRTALLMTQRKLGWGI